jgi:hypothetical protein
MTVRSSKVIEVEHEVGRCWMEKELGAGHFVSKAVLAAVSLDHGQFRTCVNDKGAAGPLPDFETLGVASRSDVNAWLAEVLEELALCGAKCVVAEDNESNPTEPRLVGETIPTGFIGDRVFSWSDLAPGTGAFARKAMGVGSHPRNSFVTTRSAAELGFIHARQAPEEFPQRVAESLLAVTVEAFDVESNLVWIP